VPLEHVASFLVAVGAGVTGTWLSDRDDTQAEAALGVATQALGSLAVPADAVA
jgi:hypothetical protein